MKGVSLMFTCMFMLFFLAPADCVKAFPFLFFYYGLRPKMTPNNNPD